MLTFITPEQLQDIVRKCGGNVVLDTATALLNERTTLTITGEDVEETSADIDRAPYAVQLYTADEGKILGVHLVNALDSGDCGGVEISVRKGAPSFTVTDAPIGSVKHLDASYRLNVIATQDGALVSAEEPFDSMGELEGAPHAEDVSSELCKHVLERAFQYKGGHFLAAHRN